MITYTVTVQRNTDTEPGAFTGMDFGEEGFFDFVDWTQDGNEVYEVYSERRIDRQLDMASGVIEYTCQNSEA